MKKLGILLVGLFVVSLLAAPAFAQHVNVRLSNSPIAVGLFGGIGQSGNIGAISQSGFQNAASGNVNFNHTNILQGFAPVYNSGHVEKGAFVGNPINVDQSSSSKAVIVNAF